MAPALSAAYDGIRKTSPDYSVCGSGMQPINDESVTSRRANHGEPSLRTAGALADDPYWDAIMEEIHRPARLNIGQK